MPAIEQIWILLTVAVVTGLIVGVILTRSLSGRHAHHSEVRWRRRLNEAQAEHELRIATLEKTLRHSHEKQDTLRQALDESDETIRLLSADGASAFEREIADRNVTIADLRKTLSHARAMLADATDHENTLQKQIDRLEAKHTNPAGALELQSELDAARAKLLDRERQLAEAETVAKEQDARLAILSEQLKDMRLLLPRLNRSIGEHEAAMAGVVAELSNQRQKTKLLQEELVRNESIEEAQAETPAVAGAKIVSLHQHRITDDLLGSDTGSAGTDQRILELESELAQWKRRYEAVNNLSPQDISIAGTSYPPGSGNQKDDLKKINGIGPVMESALNEIGVYQFRQIAEMNQHDIEQMGRYDRTLPGRIRRYKWVEQATELRATTGEKSHTDV